MTDTKELTHKDYEKLIMATETLVHVIKHHRHYEAALMDVEDALWELQNKKQPLL